MLNIAQTTAFSALEPRRRQHKPVCTTRRVYTYADCLEWPENFRAEIINGDIFVMPSPFLNHNLCEVIPVTAVPSCKIPVNEVFAE